MLMTPNEESVFTTISMGTDVDQGDFSSGSHPSAAIGQPSLMSEAPVQMPKKKRGRPRKNQDLDNLSTRSDLPSGGEPHPLSSRTAEEYTVVESPPATSTHGSRASDSELPPFPSCSLTLGLPEVYPDPYSTANSESPVNDQQCIISPVIKHRRGRPPKNQLLDKNSTNSMGSAKKEQQEEKSEYGIQTTCSCDRDKDIKRPRGRPKGSGKITKEMPEASPSPSVSGHVRDATPIAPRVLQINPGEDVARVVTSFCQKAMQPMSVLSASGAVGYMELKHEFPSRGGSTVYQGIREILSMSGYFIPVDVANERSWSSRFSVALADSGGTVIGGGVSGSMIAASKVQVILGSFTDGKTHLPQDSV